MNETYYLAHIQLTYAEPIWAVLNIPNWIPYHSFTEPAQVKKVPHDVPVDHS